MGKAEVLLHLFILWHRTKYYESAFENFRVQKNHIIITKVSKNNSNESNN